MDTQDSPSPPDLPGLPIDTDSGLLDKPKPLDRPATVSRIPELPFAELGWDNFERLCVQLARRRGTPRRYQRYGTPGQKQHGIDIYVAVEPGPSPYVVYQCKHYRKMDAATIREAVDTFLAGRWATKCSEFVFCTTAGVEDTKVADEIEVQASRLKAKDVHLLPWGRVQLSERLKDLPEIVDDFFGRQWVTEFCGRDAALALQELTRARLSLRLESQSAVREASPKNLPSGTAHEPVPVEAGIAQGEDEHPALLRPVARLLRTHQPRSALTTLDAVSIPDDGPIHARAHYLRGCAYLRLGDPVAARDALTRARAKEPSFAKATINLAVAHYGCGDISTARAVLEEFLGQNKTNKDAWALWIQVGGEIPDGGLPDSVETSPGVAAARAFRAGEEGELERAKELLDFALSKERSAERLLGQSQTLTALAKKRRDAKLLATADRLVQEALTLLPENESALRVECLIHRGVLLAESGDSAAARSAFETAAASFPVSPRALYLAAESQMHAGEIDAALTTLDGVGAEDVTIAIGLLKAQCLGRVGKQQQSMLELELAKGLLGPEPDDETLILLTQAALALDDVETAEASLNGVAVSDVRTHVLRARVFDRRGELEPARAQYERAIGMLPSDESLRGEFAMFCRRHGDNAGALEVLEPVEEITVAEHLMRLLADLLFSAGELYRSERLALRARAVPAASPWCWQLGASVALERNDLAAAETWISEWMTLAPDDWKPQLRLAHVQARLEKDKEAKLLVEPLLPRILSLPPDEAFRLTGLAAHLGLPREAVEAGYAVLRAHPNDDAVQASFLGLLFHDRSVEWPTHETVQVGSYIRLQDERGTELEYVLASADDVQPALAEISNESDLASRLLGRKLHDTVVLRDPPLKRTAKIVELEHRLTFASRWVARQLESRDPSGAPIRSFPAVDAEGNVTLAPLIELMESSAATTSGILDLYEKNAVPLGVVAAACYRSSLHDAYAAIAANDDRLLLVEYGNPAEFEQSIRATEQGACVLTRTALTTVEALGIRDILEERFDRVLIPHSLNDRLRLELSQHREAEADGRLGVGWDKGLRFHSRSASEAKWFGDAHEAIIQWVNRVATAEARPYDWRQHGGDTIWERVDDGSRDAYCLASNEDVPLFCDDLGLRRVAFALTETPGFSTYALVTSAFREGLIDAARLDELCDGLLRLGHFFVPLTGASLLRSLKAGERFTSTPSFIRLAAHLRPRSVRTAAAVSIVAEVLRQVALDSTPHDLALIADRLFDAVLRDRSQKEVKPLLLQALDQYFAVLPIHHDRIIRLFESFLRGRSLWLP